MNQMKTIFISRMNFLLSQKILIKCRRNAACTDKKDLCKRHFYRVHGQEQAFALLNFIIGKEQKMKKIGGGLDDCLSKVNSLRHHFDSNIVLFANKNDTLKIIWTV